MTAVPSSPPSQRLADRRRRTSRIHTGVIGGSLATFAAAWVMIFSQLVTGHDPALANQSQASTSATTGAAESSSANGSYRDDYSYSDPYSHDGASSSTPAPAGTPSPVTTRQS